MKKPEAFNMLVSTVWWFFKVCIEWKDMSEILKVKDWIDLQAKETDNEWTESFPII